MKNLGQPFKILQAGLTLKGEYLQPANRTEVRESMWQFPGEIIGLNPATSTEIL